jgi:hypothetical protein
MHVFPATEQLQEQVQEAVPLINKSGEFVRSRDVRSRPSASLTNRGKIVETHSGPLGIDKAFVRARLLSCQPIQPRR